MLRAEQLSPHFWLPTCRPGFPPAALANLSPARPWQGDASIAKAAALKLDAIAAAFARSTSFCPRHCLLRSILLLVYDDGAKGGSRGESTELKMMNFGFSYKLPDEAPPITHAAAWDGSAESHEDGYLTGLHNLGATLRRVSDACEPTRQHV